MKVPKNIFISHASYDNRAGNKFSNLLKQMNPTPHIFYSSLAESGVDVGDNFKNTIYKEIDTCDYFLALITPAYLRSQVCLCELSIANYRYMQSKNSKIQLILIYSSNEISDLETIVSKEIHHLVITDGRALTTFLKTFEGVDKECVQDAFDSLMHSNLRKMPMPYIGMPKVKYENIYTFWENTQLHSFRTGAGLTNEEQDEIIVNAKTVYVVAITGNGLIKARKAALVKALENGAEINVIIPNKGSETCKDVAYIEATDSQNVEQNSIRIQNEFDNVLQFLNEIYAEATIKKGTITCFCARTLFRCTMLITNSKDELLSGFLNITIPPYRTSETPSLSFLNVGHSNNFATQLQSYCVKVSQYAKDQKQIISIPTDSSKICSFSENSLEPPVKDNDNISDARLYWLQKYIIAQRFTHERSTTYPNTVLIEVSAQHPLENGRFPNIEFRARLDRAVETYRKLETQGITSCLFVPGSRHKSGNIEDQISLSKAGELYLLQQGVPHEQIFGEDVMDSYVGDSGIYNSADECFVTSSIFKDRKFGKVICICSPTQSLRKSLFYYENGIVALFDCVAADSMFHDPINEFFGSLWKTVFEDHNWQDKESFLYLKSRQDRAADNNVNIKQV